MDRAQRHWNRTSSNGSVGRPPSGLRPGVSVNSPGLLTVSEVARDPVGTVGSEGPRRTGKVCFVFRPSTFVVPESAPGGITLWISYPSTATISAEGDVPFPYEN